MDTLLEFRAGKMVLEGRQVRADPRKGLFRIARCEEGLTHVQWVDRASLVVEDDTIVFPCEAIFEKVQQSSGRVYIVKFLNDERKLFFWLQEPNTDGDDELCTSVNFLLDEAVEDDETAGPALDGRNALETGTSKNPGAGNASPSIGETGQNSSHPVQLADLQRILSNLGQGGGSSMFQDPGPSLSEVLKPDNLLPILENCHLEERLSPYLPEGNWTPDAIMELLQSPQFRQQLDMFTQALRSGQMDLSQFGIDPSQCDFTVASFLEAIENQVARAKIGNSKEDGLDDMDE